MVGYSLGFDPDFSFWTQDMTQVVAVLGFLIKKFVGLESVYLAVIMKDKHGRC